MVDETKVARIVTAAMGVPADTRETFVLEQCGQDVTLQASTLSALASAMAEIAETPPNSKTLESQLGAALEPAYALGRKLGAGAMGSVFLAQDLNLNRFVAVKAMLPHLAAIPDARRRFQREAEAVAAIRHPNVVAIYGVGSTADGTPYYVMPYIEGSDLRHILKERGRLDGHKAVRVLRDVAFGLAAVHSAGIIHRDIKPANVIVDNEGTVFLADFGIVAIVEDRKKDSGPGLTQDGSPIGTPTYMSPEQLAARDVTAATDIYALGTMGYELVTGQPPFSGRTRVEIIAAKLRDPIPRPTKFNRSVDPDYEQILIRCLDREPTLRPAATDVAEGLRRLVEKERQLAWLGTTLLLAIIILTGLTLGAWWVVEITADVNEALRIASADPGAQDVRFLEGISFAVSRFIVPVVYVAGFFLLLAVSGLVVHLRQLHLRHRFFRQVIRAGFVMPGAFGVFLITLTLVGLSSVFLVSIAPVLVKMAADADLTLPAVMRFILDASTAVKLSDQGWGMGLQLALFVLVAVWIRKRFSAGM